MRIEQAPMSLAPQLTDLAKETFIESHGHSASESDISNYVATHFTVEAFKAELANPNYIYYVLYSNDQLVGYSKLILDVATDAVNLKNVAKLERIYFRKGAHGKGLAKTLLAHNFELARSKQQAGVWLFVWIENKRAVRFYEKEGFEIVGKYDFRISETHTNPNHQLFLKF